MDTQNASGTKYDAKYDLIKFGLSLLVIAIHASLYPKALYPWLRTAVPLFFMISSYFVFSKLYNAPKAEQKGILKKFVVRNLQLYLCWFLILLPITLLKRKELYFSGNLWENLLAILRSIFFGSSFSASWFISASVIGVLLIYFLSKYLRKDFFVWIFALLAFCFVTVASSYQTLIGGTFLKTAIDKYIAVFGYLVCSFPAALFWVWIGKMAAEQKIKSPSLWLWIFLTLFSCAALLLEWKYVGTLAGNYGNDSYFMLAPVCVFLFLGIGKMKPVYWKHSVHFKRASTIIYVSHASIIPVLSRLTDRLFGFSHPLLTFSLTFLCCIAIYIIIAFAATKLRARPIAKILKMLY